MKRLILVVFILVIFILPVTPVLAADPPVYTSYNGTYNPDADPESTSVDGYVYESTSSSWSVMVAAAGDSFNDSQVGYDKCAAFYAYNIADTWWDLYRAIFLFDTSGLPDNATITAATFAVRGYTKIDQTSSTPTLNIYNSNPASDTGLAGTDYSTVGNTAFCDTAITYAGFTSSGWNYFPLNTAGINAISKTAISKFSLRTNYDVTVTAPNWVNLVYSGFGFWFAEKGDGYKPRLDVSYTLPVATIATTGHGANPGELFFFADLNSMGGSASVDVYFEYGTESGIYGYQTTPQTLLVNGSFDDSSTELPTYDGMIYFRAVAENDGGTSYSEEMSFDSRPRIETWTGVKPVLGIVPVIVLCGLFVSGGFITFKGVRTSNQNEILVGSLMIAFSIFAMVCLGMLMNSVTDFMNW